VLSSEEATAAAVPPSDAPPLVLLVLVPVPVLVLVLVLLVWY